ncbi:MAG: protein phosphatase 2C domain-containing protein [Alphaproteobacteria bacterium]|nr:protein phosphatase 2C domain-containing protein [Alphaproteobacteria bacterium]
MTLTVVDALSLPGDATKANEDAWGQDGDAAVVLDGATMLGDGLMPGPSDAAWIAQFGVRRILAHLREGAGARKALRGALGDAKKSFEALRRMPPEDLWQTPCASMMLAVRDGAQVEFLWFGDCAALLLQGDGPVVTIGETFASKSDESGFAATLARQSGKAATDRAHFTEALRARRNRINSGDNWLFTPEPKAAAHAGRRIVKMRPGAHLLLASDGFAALASDYGVYDANRLMAAAREKGLVALGEELRAIENEDAAGARFARFKKSDDATAILLRVD